MCSLNGKAAEAGLAASMSAAESGPAAQGPTVQPQLAQPLEPPTPSIFAHSSAATPLAAAASTEQCNAGGALDCSQQQSCHGQSQWVAVADGPWPVAVAPPAQQVPCASSAVAGTGGAVSTLLPPQLQYITETTLRAVSEIGGQSLLQSIFVCQSLEQPLEKFQLLTQVLVRDLPHSSLRLLLRDIVWGAIERQHRLMHPHMSTTQLLAHLRTHMAQRTVTPSTSATPAAASHGQLGEKTVDGMHRQWQRLSSLLRSERDDQYWAVCILCNPLQVTRKKLLALVSHQAVWEHLPEDDRHRCWSTLIKQSKSTAHINELCTGHSHTHWSAHALSCAVVAANCVLLRALLMFA